MPERRSGKLCIAKEKEFIKERLDYDEVGGAVLNKYDDVELFAAKFVFDLPI
jgi:hypothetical protein